MNRLLAILGLAGLAAPLSADDSLEDLLRRAREQQASARAELSGVVSVALTDFETLSTRDRERKAGLLRSKLLKLGSEAAPLLVASLEPGIDPTEGQEYRARQITQVLREMATPAITEMLLERLEAGSISGRVNALQVLETNPETKRIAPVVRDLYHVSTGRLRLASMIALARIGGPEAETLLTAALADEDSEVVKTAISALGEVKSAAVASKVIELVQSDTGTEYLRALADYYRQQPELFENLDHLVAIVQCVGRPEASSSDSVYLLEVLIDLNLELRSKARKELDPLTEHVVSEVREAALVLLARSGDKNARRDLIRPYDDAVKERKSHPTPYVERGDAWYRIGDYAESIRDYKEAIELRGNRSKEPEPFVGLARCYAQQKKYKEAKAQLDVAPLSRLKLRQLANDPAFVGMLETKYRDAFHLADE